MGRKKPSDGEGRDRPARRRKPADTTARGGGKPGRKPGSSTRQRSGTKPSPVPEPDQSSSLEVEKPSSDTEASDAVIARQVSSGDPSGAEKSAVSSPSTPVEQVAAEAEAAEPTRASLPIVTPEPSADVPGSDQVPSESLFGPEGETAVPDAPADSPDAILPEVLPGYEVIGPITVEELLQRELAKAGGNEAYAATASDAQADASVDIGTAARVGSWLAPLAVGFIAGPALAWQWEGMQRLVIAGTGVWPGNLLLCIAAALLAAAAGQRMARPLAGVLLTVAGWLRRAGPGMGGRGGADTATSGMRRTDDGALSWLVVAVLALASATAAGLTLIASEGISAGYRRLIDGFLWTELTLTAAEWLLGGLLFAPLWMINGLLVKALRGAGDRSMGEPRRTFAASTGLLAGLGVALAGGGSLLMVTSASQEMLLGVLACCILACGSALLAYRHETRRMTPASSPPPSFPDAEPLSSLTARIMLGPAVGLIVCGWLCLSVAGGACPLSSLPTLGGTLALAVSAGLLIAGFIPRGSASRQSRGADVWTAGLGASAALISRIWLPEGEASPLPIMLLGVPLGWSLGRLSGMESSAEARLSGRGSGAQLLCGLTVGLIAGYQFALPGLGAGGTVALGALMMLGAGGLAHIYQGAETGPRQQRRLAGVFAGLALAVFLFPMTVRQSVEMQRRSQPERVATLPPLPLEGDRHRPRSVCLVGVGADAARIWMNAQPPKQGVQDPPRLVVLYPPPGESRLEDTTGLGPGTAERLRARRGSVFRGLMLDRRRFDFIYQQVQPGPLGSSWEKSLEWFDLLSRRVAEGGRVVVDVPLAGMGPAEVGSLAATFGEAMGPSASYSLLEPASDPLLRLEASSGQAVPSSGSENHYPVDLLIRGTGVSRLRSLRYRQIPLSSGVVDRSDILPWLSALPAPRVP